MQQRREAVSSLEGIALGRPHCFLEFSDGEDSTSNDIIKP